MELFGKLPLANVLDLLVDAICIVDAEGRFLFVSGAGRTIFGYEPEEMIGRPMIELVHPDDRARTLAAVDEIVTGVQLPCFENRYVRKDGQTVHIMWTARWSPTWQMRVAVARDVSARKHAEDKQAALYAISEAAFGAEDLDGLFARSHDIIGRLMPADGFLVALCDPARNHLTFPFHFDKFEAVPADGPLDSGSLSAQVIRQREALRLSADPQHAAARRAMADVGVRAADWLGVPLISGADVIGVLAVKNQSGDKEYSQADAELLKFVSTQVAATITRKQTESHLRHVAQHDSLTNLPNRSLIFDRITSAMASAHRTHKRLALLFLDLDTFKLVNDSFGHVIGDRLLQQVAQRLKRCVRESDTVGRMAGDEFVVLLGNIQDPQDSGRIAEKIRLSLCEPFEIDGLRLSISPSIGMANYPDHGDNVDQLLGIADQAMYKAKNGGGNRVVAGCVTQDKPIDPGRADAVCTSRCGPLED